MIELIGSNFIDLGCTEHFIRLNLVIGSNVYAQHTKHHENVCKLEN